MPMPDGFEDEALWGVVIDATHSYKMSVDVFRAIEEAGYAIVPTGLLHDVAVVYEHVTGGVLSKEGYSAQTVITYADESTQKDNAMHILEEAEAVFPDELKRAVEMGMRLLDIHELDPDDVGEVLTMGGYSVVPTPECPY